MGKEQSKDARIGEIDWSKRNLEELDNELIANYQHQNISILNISFNKLTKIHNIGQLQTITKLDAKRNLLVDYDCTQLRSLTFLDLSFNKLTQLPKSIGILEQIVELRLSNNQINSISDEIGNLENLKFLDLSQNKIKELPVSFGKLIVLENLYLNNNLLTKCYFGELFSLKMIDLSSNQLTELPDLTFLASMQKLYANHNRISSLTQNIANVPKLKELSLKGNKLQALPKEICLLENLILLDLEDNSFADTEVYTSNNIPLLFKYIQAPLSEKRKIVSECKLSLQKEQDKQKSVKITLSEIGLDKNKVSSQNNNQDEFLSIGKSKKLYLLVGTKEQVIIERMNVHYSSLSDYHSFVFDTGNKLFIWQGKFSNSFERAKGESLCQLMVNNEMRGVEIVPLDSGLFEDSPLLPEGFNFWDNLGGKGNYGVPSIGKDGEIKAKLGNNEIITEFLHKIRLYSIVENDNNHQVSVSLIGEGNQLSKELLNSSHCYVLDTWSAIYVWSGIESNGNEKSWALLKAEELENENGRPECVSTNWVVDGDELVIFKEYFQDWADQSWKNFLQDTIIPKAIEITDVSTYDKVIILTYSLSQKYSLILYCVN